MVWEIIREEIMNVVAQHTTESLRFALITVSDTRTTQTDISGPCMKDPVVNSGHRIVTQCIVPDEPNIIQATIHAQSGIADVVCLSGGTGISHRDQTYEAVYPLLDKELPGFGELFRLLSWKQVGSRAMLSRAVAGTCAELIIFSIPGSPKAVTLAMEELILPEVQHLLRELHKDNA